MVKKSTYNILIGGPAGSGIELSGLLLGKALMRAGASVFVCSEIMSQIRGGHNFNRVRFSFEEEVFCHDDRVDVVVALDRLSVEAHKGDLYDGGVVVGEELDSAAAALGGTVHKNVLALGFIYGIFGLETGTMAALLKQTFEGKGAEVVEDNLKAFAKGVEISGEVNSASTGAVPVLKNLQVGESQSRDRNGKKFAINNAGLSTLRRSTERLLLLNGNDAICLGAVASGCKFVSEYPMTPSSSILHTMAKWSAEKGIVVKHAEDEIAAMNMIVGGGFAGARTMTGTSGGGFALMTEAVGMAGMSETPCVVIEAQRTGPSTGFPTRTEQGDLRQVLHASQGEYPRLVMAPGDMKEAFEMGFSAFNYAEVFQIPVLVLMDKFISESLDSVPLFSIDGLKIERGKLVSKIDVKNVEGGFFKRYALSTDGVSSRTLPGTSGGMHVATSYEHDEYSQLLEDPLTRKSQMEKRMKKNEEILKVLPKPELIWADEQNGEADVTFVAFGSTKMVLMEVIGKLAAQGVRANILMIKYLAPFQSEEVLAMVKKAKRPVLVEQNFSGILGGLITEKTGFMINEKILKYDGREMDAEYVLGKLSLFNS